jgi:hypothetical protein
VAKQIAGLKGITTIIQNHLMFAGSVLPVIVSGTKLMARLSTKKQRK